jgi:hypothetical protein
MKGACDEHSSQAGTTTHAPDSSGRAVSPGEGILEALLDDKAGFTTRLAETFDEREIVELMLAMGLRYSDLALALGVHPRTVRAWIDEQDRGLTRQRDGILAMKALVLFLLRRGILMPRQIALWLVEPLETLQFRRPLAVLAEGRLDDVVNASSPFTRPEPALEIAPASKPAVAAGAAARAHGPTR